jgi:DNA-binding CsgD family transcriptional regulator
MERQPLIVVEDDESVFRGSASELERQGFRLHHGWDLGTIKPNGGSAIVCVGDVRSGEQAGAALYTAVRGHGVVAHVPHTHGELATFVDDLGRIGPVELGRMGLPARHEPPLLESGQCDLVRLLASGRTIAEAARDLHISLRTANRRLARVRVTLGAASTAQAVHAARRNGWC